MAKRILVGGVWLATLVLAWALGASRADRSPPRSTRPTAAVPAAPAPRVPPRAAPGPAAAAETVPTRVPAARPPSPVRHDPEPLSLDGLVTAEEASDCIMAYAARKLAQGPEGHLELYRTLNALIEEEELERFVQDENQAIAMIYPWLKFLVAHDREVAAMMETVYRTAAENPAWFEDTDKDMLELFTEGFAPILPGAVGHEQLTRLRAHVERILAHPQGSLPRALESNRRDFERNLKQWIQARTPEEIRRELESANLPLRTQLELMSKLPPGTLRELDALKTVVDALDAGESRALAVVPRLAPGPYELALLDDALLRGLAAGRGHYTMIRTYLAGTGRRAWAEAAPLIERGIALGGPAAEACARALPGLQDVPVEFARAVSEMPGLSNHARGVIRRKYGFD